MKSGAGDFEAAIFSQRFSIIINAVFLGSVRNIRLSMPRTKFRSLCGSATPGKCSTEYIDWMNSHGPKCTANFEISSNAMGRHVGQVHREAQVEVRGLCR